MLLQEILLQEATQLITIGTKATIRRSAPKKFTEGEQVEIASLVQSTKNVEIKLQNNSVDKIHIRHLDFGNDEDYYEPAREVKYKGEIYVQSTPTFPDGTINITLKKDKNTKTRVCIDTVEVLPSFLPFDKDPSTYKCSTPTNKNTDSKDSERNKHDISFLGKYSEYAVDITDSTFSTFTSKVLEKYKQIQDKVMDKLSEELISAGKFPAAYVLLANNIPFIVGKTDDGDRFKVLFSDEGIQGHNKFPSARLAQLVYPDNKKRYIILPPKGMSPSKVEDELKALLGFSKSEKGENKEAFGRLVDERIKQLKSIDSATVSDIISPEMSKILTQLIGAQSFGEYPQLLNFASTIQDEEVREKYFRALELLFELKFDLKKYQEFQQDREKKEKQGKNSAFISNQKTGNRSIDSFVKPLSLDKVLNTAPELDLFGDDYLRELVKEVLSEKLK